MNVSFTARMENALDDIGEGGKDWHKLIADFYRPFENMVKKSKITDVKCEKCGAPMTINSGKFGNYYACSNYPECKNIKPVNEKVVIPTDQICEKCGGMMVEREGKYGKFLACSNYPKCKNTRAVNEVKSEEKCPKCGELMVENRGSSANICTARTVRTPFRRRKPRVCAPYAASRRKKCFPVTARCFTAVPPIPNVSS